MGRGGSLGLNDFGWRDQWKKLILEKNNYFFLSGESKQKNPQQIVVPQLHEGGRGL